MSFAAPDIAQMEANESLMQRPSRFGSAQAAKAHALAGVFMPSAWCGRRRL